MGKKNGKLPSAMKILKGSFTISSVHKFPLKDFFYVVHILRFCSEYSKKMLSGDILLFVVDNNLHEIKEKFSCCEGSDDKWVHIFGKFSALLSG